LRRRDVNPICSAPHPGQKSGAAARRAQQQGDEARKAVLNAIGLPLEQEWNAAVKQLAAVGSRILAVSYQKGGMGDALSRLKVPRFGPGVSSLDRGDLAAAASGISLADLLAA